jgi:hypothetical protein
VAQGIGQVQTPELQKINKLRKKKDLLVIFCQKVDQSIKVCFSNCFSTKQQQQKNQW